jgi:hypothetical protein
MNESSIDDYFARAQRCRKLLVVVRGELQQWRLLRERLRANQAKQD